MPKGDEQADASKSVDTTDDALASAFGASTDEEENESEGVSTESEEGEAEEEEQVEETPEEEAKRVAEEKKAAHKERSDLGRKVSDLNSKFEMLTNQLGQMMEMISSGQLPARAQGEQEPEEEFSETDFLTVKDLQKYLDRKERKQTFAQAQYEKNYLGHVNQLGTSEDPQLHQQIVDEMLKNFNVKYSENPKLDADLNYNKAARAVLKKQQSLKKVSPLKGGKSKLPTGVGGDLKTKTKKAAIPELDAYAKEFVRSTGMSEESVKKALLR